jgi:predicted NACHT family NTPase
MLETYLQFLTRKANEKGLTPAPTKILLALLEEGKTKKEVIDNLHISEPTFRSHMNVVYSSFGIEGKGTGKIEKLRVSLEKEYQKSNSLASANTKTSEDNRDYLMQQPSLHSAEVPQAQEEAQAETVSKNPDFVGREEAIAESTSENELDELVRRVREKRYSKIQDQCGTLRILDVEQEIEIDDLYIDVNVLEEIPSYKYKKFPELLEGLNPDEINRIGFGRHQERLLGLKAVEKYRKLMMLGQPGAGKTTFLQHIAIECNQGRFQAKCVPIFIRLREFTENAKDVGDFSLFNYISHEFNCCHISEPEQTITKLLHDGRALILLDGLDEVPEQDREEVLKQIRKFVRDYFSNQLIITCRIAEGQSRFKNFTNVEIADFTPEQIEKFAKKCFVSLAQKSNRDEQEGFQKATKLMEKLNENERLLELAVTPLLLTLICLVFQHGDELPAKRSELYEKGMNILLAKWDKYRDIKRDEIYRNLSPYEKIKLLSHVASATFEQSPYYLFEQHTVQRHIADFLGTLPDADPDSEQLFHDSEAVLQAIGVQHGLLTAQAQGIYSFSHQTFQEYLVARKFVSRTEPHHLEKLVSHITDPHWREVFILASEMVPNKGHLLKLMKKKIDELIAKDIYWQYFLTWVSQKSHVITAPYKRAAIRAYYLQHGSAIDLSLAYSLDPSLKKRSPELYLDILLSKALHLSLRVSHELDIYSHELNNSSVFTLADFLDDCIQYARAATTNLLQQELQQLISDLPSEVQQILKRRKSWGQPKKLEQIPQIDINDNIERCKEWWQTKGSEWAKRLRRAAAYRDIHLFGYMTYHDELLAENQRGKLYQYYEANRLLVDCLNSPSDVSPEVRSHIEDTLLLPIAEIEKRKLGD